MNKIKRGVVLLAAGRGSRMQGQVEDKILAPLLGRPAIEYSLLAFQASGLIDEWVIVYRDDAQRQRLFESWQRCCGEYGAPQWVVGGAERQDSVVAGITALSESTDAVFIHDCARPLVSVQALQALATAVERDQAAVLAHRVADTIKRVEGDLQLGAACVLQDLDRSKLWAMETPQAFSRKLILAAYARVRQDRVHVTDDTAAAAYLGHSVAIVENKQPNPKLTTPGDILYLESLLRQSSSL